MKSIVRSKAKAQSNQGRVAPCPHLASRVSLAQNAYSLAFEDPDLQTSEILSDDGFAVCEKIKIRPQPCMDIRQAEISAIKSTIKSHEITPNSSSEDESMPMPMPASGRRRRRVRPKVTVIPQQESKFESKASSDEARKRHTPPPALLLLFIISSLSSIFGLLTLGNTSQVLRGIITNNKLQSSISAMDVGSAGDGGGEDGWGPQSTARIVVLTTRGPSPYKTSWSELLAHIGRRLSWTNSTFEVKTFIQEDLSTKDLNKALKDSQIFLGFGLSLDPSAFDSIDLAPTTIFLDSNESLKELSRLPLGDKNSWYLNSNLNNFFSIAASNIPSSPQAKAKSISSVLGELLARRNSDDFLFIFLVLINQFQLVPEVAATTKGSDLKSIQCMLTHCSKEIFACVGDATCKKGLDCLQECSFNDQVCQYRCIVSYESLRFSEFALCILQKHNCRSLDAKVPNQPNPAPMSMWQSAPLTHEAAEDILFGWRGSGADQLPFSWLVAAGKNPAYDYFPAQHQIFVRDRGALWYVPVFKVLTMDGREVWRKRKYRVRRGPEPGSFHFTVLDNGVTSNEYWRILDAASDKSWALFFYQGAAKTAGLSYSGAVLATPDGLMPADPDGRISAALDRGGIKSWELSLVDNRPQALEGAPLGLAEMKIAEV